MPAHSPRRTLASMRIRLFAVAVGILGLGCSSASSTAAPSGPCEARSGSYAVHMAEQPGGECGTMPDQVVVTGGATQAEAESTCTGGVTNAADNCSTIVDQACPGNPGYTLGLRGKLSWAHNGSSGSGLLTMTLRHGATYVCTGTYAVTYTRQ